MNRRNFIKGIAGCFASLFVIRKIFAKQNKKSINNYHYEFNNICTYGACAVKTNCDFNIGEIAFLDKQGLITNSKNDCPLGVVLSKRDQDNYINIQLWRSI